jgi:general secretion pathway protein F
MPVFTYKAVDMDESPVAGTLTADTPRQARDVLRGRGLLITQVAALAKETSRWPALARRGRRAQGEVIAFIRETATLLQAGIPLLETLATLQKQHRGRFRAVVQKLADDVASGLGMAEALAQHPLYFDAMCVSIVQVGENTGSLESALQHLAEFLEKSHALRSRILTALAYPAVVLFIGVVVAIFLMTYVVPNLLGTLVQAGKDLPAVTQAVKGVSDFLLGWWWALVVGTVAAVVAAKAILRTARGRMAADRLLLRIPVLGELVRKENTSRMAVVLAALLRSGLPFVEAVRITRGTLRNRVFQRAMDDYAAAVTAGRDVAEPLASSGVFSPMVVQMLAVGQQAGQLEDMLQQLAQSYDQQLATATQRLTAVLEPVLIVLLAVLVGFIAFATILPILEASNVL